MAETLKWTMYMYQLFDWCCAYRVAQNSDATWQAQCLYVEMLWTVQTSYSGGGWACIW